MHKIKGKEFDKVFLLLDNFALKSPAQARVVYVAITRPRNYLEIHTHLPIFDQIHTQGLIREQSYSKDTPLRSFSTQCSLSDVVLSHFHQDDIRQRADSLMAGDHLDFLHGTNFHKGFIRGSRNEMAVCFSSSFKKKLDRYFDRGFSIKSMIVGYIVYWWDKNKEQRVKVILPELELERIE